MLEVVRLLGHSFSKRKNVFGNLQTNLGLLFSANQTNLQLISVPLSSFYNMTIIYLQFKL